MQDVPVILCRAWQKRYNCFFNWKNNLVHCQSGNEKLWILLHTTKTSTQELAQGNIASKPNIALTSKENTPQVRPSDEQEPSTNLTLKWVPKNTSIKTNQTLIWVPKDSDNKAQSSIDVSKQEDRYQTKHKQVTSDTYSLEYKWVPKATKEETLNDSVGVPKEVQLPSTSTSIK